MKTHCKNATYVCAPVEACLVSYRMCGDFAVTDPKSATVNCSTTTTTTTKPSKHASWGRLDVKCNNNHQ